MDSDCRAPNREETRGVRQRRVAAALCALLGLLIAPAAQAVSGSGSSGARASRLAHALPAEAEILEQLREPASTTQAQVGVALDQLEQMQALVYDPHYLPALVAVGRAFSAVSGRDPITGTVVNPEYTGLDEELGASASRLRTSAAEAQKLRREVGRLNRHLALAKRRLRRR